MIWQDGCSPGDVRRKWQFIKTTSGHHGGPSGDFTEGSQSVRDTSSPPGSVWTCTDSPLFSLTPTLSNTPCGWDPEFCDQKGPGLGRGTRSGFPRGICGVWKGGWAGCVAWRVNGWGELRDSAHLIEVRSDERWFPRLRIGAGRPTFLFLGCHAKGGGALASELGSGPEQASLLP